MEKISIEFIILEITVILIYIIAIIKDKLTIGGANSALFVGTIISICGFEYMMILIGFFASSIKATDIHKKIKTNLLGQSYFKDKKRNSTQVLSKSIFPTIICLIIYYFYNGKLHLFNNNNNKIIKFLYGIYIGFFESANADTWASELGINSKENPILLLKFKKVPKGINGAISLYGTICSILGGLFIAIITVFSSLFRDFSLINFYNLTFYLIFFKIIFLGMIIGFIGSFIDSILGETVQITYYDEKKKCVVEKSEIDNMENIKIYGRDILDNSQVNLITGIVTSILSGFLFVLFI